jgi:hypothetical protein
MSAVDEQLIVTFASIHLELLRSAAAVFCELFALIRSASFSQLHAVVGYGRLIVAP